MEVYKRKINLKDFGILYDSGTSKDYAVQECNEFLPHRGNENIMWGTFNHYLGWLNKFISEAGIYKSVKRFDEFVLVNARENDIELHENLGYTEYKNATKFWYQEDETEEEKKKSQKYILEQWLSEGIGVYSTEYEAKNAVTQDNCGGILFVHPEAETFKEMFSDCHTAAEFLDCPKNGSKPQYINLPVYIASDVEDLGMFEVYDAEQAAEGTGWDDNDVAEYLTRFENVEVSRVIAQEGTLYVESQLNTLQRTKKKYDEDGNVLPYFWNEDTKKNELPYVIGLPCNVIYSDGSFLFNVLESVKYYNEGLDTPVAVDEMYPNTIPDNGIIEFIYLVNTEISGNTCCGGVEYRERRRYTVEEVSNGRAIIVDDETLDVPENYEEGVQYAIVDKIDSKAEAVYIAYKDRFKGCADRVSEDLTTIYSGSTSIVASEDNFGDSYYVNGNEYISSSGNTRYFWKKYNGIGCYLFKNDAFINIQDSKIVANDVYIDRGASAAYEAFNALGETNTIEDIENYRDDWFRIRGKND